MNQLILFAKAPRPGRVKTRLAQTIGQEKACLAYCRLLQEIADHLGGIEKTTVCYSPRDAESVLRPFFPEAWRFCPQEGGDLGARLTHAVATAFKNGSAKVAVIGSDCPYINRDDVAHAWELLDKNDVVFGPACDGGYWLVAVKKPDAELFKGIHWGTGAVLSESVDRAQSLGLRMALLRTLPDIDTESDWNAFLSQTRWRG